MIISAILTFDRAIDSYLQLFLKQMHVVIDLKFGAFKQNMNLKTAYSSQKLKMDFVCIFHLVESF